MTSAHMYEKELSKSKYASNRSYNINRFFFNYRYTSLLYSPYINVHYCIYQCLWLLSLSDTLYSCLVVWLQVWGSQSPAGGSAGNSPVKTLRTARTLCCHCDKTSPLKTTWKRQAKEYFSWPKMSSRNINLGKTQTTCYPFSSWWSSIRWHEA